MKLLFPTDGNYTYWKEVVLVLSNNRHPFTLRSDYDRQFKFWEIPDQEFTTITAPFIKLLSNDIVDGDVLYFEKGTKFPKLFLGACGAPLKRTIKSAKATKIIINDEILDKISSIVNSQKVWLITEVFNTNDRYSYKTIYYIYDNTLTSYNKTINDVLKYLESLGINVESYTLCRSFDRFLNEDNITNLLSCDKIVGVSKLNNYLNSKLPALDNETKDTLISMFKSNDVEQQKLAVDMLKTCSTSNILVDLFIALSGYRVLSGLNSSVKNSIAFKYILEVGGITISDLRKWNYSYESTLRQMSDLYHSNIIDSGQKKKLWEHYSKLVCGNTNGPNTRSEKEKFYQFNMPISI